MAVTTHLEIYRGFTPEELVEERAALMTKRRGYLSQSVGGKSYTQDLNRIDEQLQALTRVQRGRTGPQTGGEGSRGTADFTGWRM